MCEAYGLPLEISKIGFKYICGIMVSDDVLVGGEESGGIAIKGYIPERDGIWIGLTLMEYMAKSGKSLSELVAEVYKVTGPFANHRNDLHLDEAKKQEIVKNCKDRVYKAFGPYEVREVEDIDGYKFLFDNDENVMIRPSGTEPVLRIYAESDTLEGAEKILAEVKRAIL
jgi:phosphomannomutase